MHVKTSVSISFLGLCAFFFLFAPLGAQTTPQNLPTGVTEKMLSDGAKVFNGPGLCMACHGPEAKGIPGLGANLTDSEWLHSDGSYEKIVETIMKGTQSAAGVAMPPKGGSAISDADVKAVAAYVWSLSHQTGQGPAR